MFALFANNGYLCQNKTNTALNHNRLKQARKSKGINITQAAKATGIHRANISRIEDGKANPYLNTFLGYCDYLGLQVLLIPKDDLK